MTTKSQQTRQTLRKTLRQRRRDLSSKEQQTHARQMARNLQKNRFFKQAKHIALYLAADGEMSADYLIDIAWRERKKVYLPVLSPYADTLFFAPYNPNSKMQLNRFGISEPAKSIKKCKRAHQLQLIFMPLVGFDTDCNRLGMGGGFYDRSLHFRSHQKKWRKPRLIGLAHECQRAELIPIEKWDVPADAIVTEKSLYKR
jgi:5-formyltetrahydrofolate cyclo-ligase